LLDKSFWLWRYQINEKYRLLLLLSMTTNKITSHLVLLWIIQVQSQQVLIKFLAIVFNMGLLKKNINRGVLEYYNAKPIVRK
jgi:hypothetical protein